MLPKQEKIGWGIACWGYINSPKMVIPFAFKCHPILGGTYDDVYDRSVSASFVHSLTFHPLVVCFSSVVVSFMICSIYILALLAVTWDILLNMSMLDPPINILFQLVALLGGMTKVLVIGISLEFVRLILGFSQRKRPLEERFAGNGTYDIFPFSIEGSIVCEFWLGRAISLTFIRWPLHIWPWWSIV